MKLKVIVSGIGITPLTYLFSCVGATKVFTDFDPDYSIKNFKTFGWTDSKQLEAKGNPLYYNELNDKRIKKEVELQMTGKGYQLAAKSPGLIMDPKTNNLVWRGWAVGFLDEERPDQTGKQIKRAIQNIFAKF